MKKILIITLLFSIKVFSQEKDLRQTKADELLEALSFFVDTPQKTIDSLNTSGNMNIDFKSKFDKIDSLIASGIITFYDKKLIPTFKENYIAYRNGEKDKALSGFKTLMEKGFAPATYIYTNSFENIRNRNKYLKIGISQCCNICRIPIMKDEYDKTEKEMMINLPSKCYK